MLETDYDVMIIGGGQAGIPLAYDLAEAGWSVALAERENLGGSCVNFGCTPTKAALASARVAHLARRGQEFGLEIPTVEVDFPAVLERARKILLDSRHGLDQGFRESENPRLIRGHARLEGRIDRGTEAAFRIRVEGRPITASQVILDTGTRSLIPPVEGLESVKYLHAGNWLENPDLPAHLAVIGGGYVGLEMGQFYRRMGSRVTILQSSAQIAGHEDEEVASALKRLLEAEGIEILINAGVDRVSSEAGGVALRFTHDGVPKSLSTSHLFVATGRRPNTDDLGLETVGVRTDDRGVLPVDPRLSTNVKGIWAAGDIRGGPMFTHTSWDDYRVLKSQLIGDGSRTTDRVVPYALFTDPELGRVGMTEREAREEDREIKVRRYEMKKNGKASEIGETDGFIMVVVDERTDRILGAAVLAAHGAELVHLFVEVMNADVPYTVIRDAIHIHPTLAEAVQSAVNLLDS